MSFDLQTIISVLPIIGIILSIIATWITVKNFLNQKKEREQKMLKEKTPEIEIYKTTRNKTKILRFINIKGVPIINFTIEILNKKCDHKFPNIKELKPRNLNKGEEVEVLYSSSIEEENIYQFKIKWEDINKKQYEEIREMELN